MPISTLHLGIFYMLQIYNMGPTALLPFRRKACWRFYFALRNPTASAGFEPANLGTKGQHATSRPPKPLGSTVISLLLHNSRDQVMAVWQGVNFNSQLQVLLYPCWGWTLLLCTFHDKVPIYWCYIRTSGMHVHEAFAGQKCTNMSLIHWLCTSACSKFKHDLHIGKLFSCTISDTVQCILQ